MSVSRKSMFYNGSSKARIWFGFPVNSLSLDNKIISFIFNSCGEWLDFQHLHMKFVRNNVQILNNCFNLCYRFVLVCTSPSRAFLNNEETESHTSSGGSFKAFIYWWCKIFSSFPCSNILMSIMYSYAHKKRQNNAINAFLEVKVALMVFDFCFWEVEMPLHVVILSWQNTDATLLVTRKSYPSLPFCLRFGKGNFCLLLLLIMLEKKKCWSQLKIILCLCSYNFC